MASNSNSSALPLAARIAQRDYERLQSIANQKKVNQGKLVRQIILDELECQKINYPAA